MSAKPTGHYEVKPDGLYLQFDRLFHAPIEDVWFSLTNPTATRAWIGTYTGSPATGGVRFKMTAEGDDAPWQNVSILECDAPHLFRIDVDNEPHSWRLQCRLREAGGLTTLTFAHRLDESTRVAEIGPGWDYYLDRLIAARAGLAAPVWEDYFPRFSEHYRSLHVPAVARPGI